MEKYWIGFKNHYPSILAVASFFGGLNQLVILILISPSLYMFYSPVQGLLEGIMFLFFLLVIVGYLILFNNVSAFVREKLTTFWQLFILVIHTLFLAVLSKTVMHTDYVWIVAYYLFISAFLSITFIRNDSTSATDGGIDSQVERKKNNKELFTVITCFLVVSFIVFNRQIVRIRSQFDKEIFNYKLAENIVNDKETTSRYKMVYSNGNYIFLKDAASTSIIILKIDDVLSSERLEK